MLKRMKNALWFVLELLVTKNESYSYGFYKALIEKVKNSRDALEPFNEALNKVC
jgi:sister-chromatid-cohesion protein PDS5